MITDFEQNTEKGTWYLVFKNRHEIRGTYINGAIRLSQTSMKKLSDTERPIVIGFVGSEWDYNE